jgi:hypothetical protein
MTRLRQRKTKLEFITENTVRYAGRDREVVIEAHPQYALVRLLGTRVYYAISWRTIHDQAARIATLGRMRKGGRA